MKKSIGAFLFILLGSNLTPRIAQAAVATMNSPVAAAQKALQTALTGLDAAGWPAASEAASVSQPLPTIVAKNGPPKAESVMTEELMARLIKYTRGVEAMSSVSKQTCKIFDLCDGKDSMPTQSAEAETMTDGATHFFAMSRIPDSKEILFLRVSNDIGLESFLTDKTGKLRAAAIQKDGVARLIPNEEAAAQYAKELALFAREAADLPPTGTAVAGK